MGALFSNTALSEKTENKILLYNIGYMWSCMSHSEVNSMFVYFFDSVMHVEKPRGAHLNVIHGFCCNFMTSDEIL